MIASRLLLVAALAFTAYAGEDYNDLYEISECLRHAIKEGPKSIPILQIPSHSPLRIGRDLTWHGDIEYASATLHLSEIVWTGIPDWNISVSQISRDRANKAVFDFEVLWNRFSITSQYYLETKVGFVSRKRIGDLRITLDGIKLEGEVGFNKPNHNFRGRIDYLNFKGITVGEVDFRFSNIGAINKLFSKSLEYLAKTFLASGALGDLVGKNVKEIVNRVFFARPEIIDGIRTFCRLFKLSEDITHSLILF